VRREVQERLRDRGPVETEHLGDVDYGVGFLGCECPTDKEQRELLEQVRQAGLSNKSQ